MRLETFSYGVADGWSVDGRALHSLPALDSERTLVLAFGAPEFADRQGPLEALRRAYPCSTILGCSTSGEIHQYELRDQSLSVAVVRFDESYVRSACFPVPTPERSFETGVELARSLDAPDLRAIFVLSDGLRVNGSELVAGLGRNVADSVVVSGGLAGDCKRFQSTWVWGDAGRRTATVCAVGLYGDRLHIGHGSKGGWDFFAPERRITRSSGNVLYEVDHQPALDLYKRYLGERANGLPTTALRFPLALRDPIDEVGGKTLVRTILAVDEVTKSMTFAGNVPEGHMVQLMRANFDRLIEGAGQAAVATRCHAQTEHPTLSIAISGVGRRLILGERTEEEIEAALDEMPSLVRQVGFYSNGEISPFANGSCDLHNQTMTLTTVSEF